ncbi:hypothetical protein [Gemmiger sp.]|uniref:hypothetical protein n=1 Tax=Gemmiger sp. TaxID=2049027 RepID=UPI00266B7756|nr:hypothetical protein [uncultured Gemmiger sp.]
MPRRFIGASAHEGQAFPGTIACLRWISSVAAVDSRAKVDGIAIDRSIHGFI